ncbi:MAG: hypothetical protein IH897_12050, partial [Planctomycetes bacterium]|nr:hypothetical protein [Planctomycetota bacterium]
MPLSVLMPAPVNATPFSACLSHSASCLIASMERDRTTNRWLPLILIDLRPRRTPLSPARASATLPSQGFHRMDRSMTELTRVAFVSLGCAKNLVDSEKMLGQLAEADCAITADESELDRLARRERWLKRFEMWDWIGGRTSELSAVGLVPAALQGIDIDALLDGASRCDAVTRVHDATANPAALLALMWFAAGRGKGEKNMIVIPYKDRLALLSRYLQQLIMESLGKKVDRDGRTVHQGITVYGNKGSTDQHAYVQQLRDGTDDFFVTFIEVLRDREGESLLVEEDVTSGDYLHGFLHGTRRALFEAGRQSITITIDEVSARSVGVLIALFERAVGFYASLINVNAYHQPGVEAGKKAAEHILAIQRKLLRKMRQDAAVYRTAEEWAETIGVADD